MKRRPNLTEAEKLAILAAIEAGENRDRIAERFGRERKSLDTLKRRYDQAHGIEHHSHTHKLTAEIRQAIVTEYRRGTPSAEVAMMFKVSQGYVTTLARANHEITDDCRQNIQGENILDNLPTTFTAMLAAMAQHKTR